MPVQPGPIDYNALHSVMFQSAGPANRDGHSHDGPRHPGYINPARWPSRTCPTYKPSHKNGSASPFLARQN
jgi:hypothetical protein